jgi:alkanesulfonate monooxygenase SsuD/methylene tetrahydromethanopterin reductase-like flavin-dependent oxidoreductase (luciferase family)
MQFAIDIPNFGAFADPHLTADVARDAEAAGWDAIWVWDHTLRDRGVPYADPWILLATIALATTRVRLGPMVSPLPRRRPWSVAREAVTLDHLSGGRFTLGLGLGNPPREFSAVGEDADPKVRAAKLDEGLAIVAECWTGKTFSFLGEHYRLEDVEFLPEPLQQPRIPVWLAATWPVRAPFRRAALWDGVWPIRRNPDGTALELTPQDVRDILEFVATERDSAERRTTAEREATERGATYLSTTAPFDVLVHGVTSGDDSAQAAAITQPLAEAGATWWTERINPLRGSLEVMRERVRQGPPRF